MSIGLADIGAVRDSLLAVGLALPRMLVCILLIPVFSSSVLPRTIRIAIAIGFTLPVSYGIALSPASASGGVEIVLLILKEAFIGILLGFTFASPFWAIESVGALLDNQRGANAAQQNTPFGRPDASLIGEALLQSLIAFLALTGGLSALYQLLLTSYEAWPVMSLTPDFSEITAATFVARFGELCRLALLYAMPLLGVTLLIDFCFALAGLFATQLQVNFAAMPVKSLVGIFVLMLYLGMLLEHGSDYLAKAIEDQASIFQAIIER